MCKRLVIYTLIFGFALFFQCILFNSLAFHTIPIRAFYQSPIDFWAFYIPKISICLFLASLVPFFRRKGWTVVACIIVSVWIMAELVYYRANGIFLDAYSFTMVGNMKGFWNSIETLVRPSDLLLLIPVAIIVCTYCFLKTNTLSSHFAIILLATSVFLHLISPIVLEKHFEKTGSRISGQGFELKLNPFSEEEIRAFWGFTSSDYAYQTSVIHCLFLDIIELPGALGVGREEYDMTENEKKQVGQFLNQYSYVEPSNYGGLYIILFESLENWAITKNTTPVLFDFISSHNNILWAQRIRKQTKGGTSADGQMIINTGLLPCSTGAACFRFPNNVYPSLSAMYDRTALVNPGDLGTWNQKRMSDAYGIHDNYSIRSCWDEHVFTKACNICKDYSYMMIVTVASHAPFKIYSDRNPVRHNPNMPEMMKDYLNCVHYTDSCMGEFLSLFDSDSTLNNSTLVITGDHTIFDADVREKFKSYCISDNEPYRVDENYCPLIIYSPKINEKTIIQEEAYQMDIYPTVLNILGMRDKYYWKGFGVDLLDIQSNRIISEDDAFDLSDKILRANYFNEIVESSE